jgi:hypothetical protein
VEHLEQSRRHYTAEHLEQSRLRAGDRALFGRTQGGDRAFFRAADTTLCNGCIASMARGAHDPAAADGGAGAVPWERAQEVFDGMPQVWHSTL